VPNFTLIPLPWAPDRDVMLDVRRTITPEGFGSTLTTWPLTILPARYQGGYEGGRWLAFPVQPGEMDHGPLADWDASDVECAMFWRQVDEQRWPIGRGATPDTAYQDLLDRLAELSGVPPTLDEPEP
jgi:hypothetical protein